MPACSAINCHNNSSDKIKMCIFPLNDPERCEIWIKNVGRKQWKPNKNSFLCQFHFAPEMWQNRPDMMKLKNDAVPTIFDNLDHQMMKQVPTECSSEERVPDMNTGMMTGAKKNDSLVSNECTILRNENSINMSTEIEESSEEDEDEEFIQCDEMHDNGDCSNCSVLQQKLEKYQARYNKMCLTRRKNKQTIRSLKLKNQRLEQDNICILESMPIHKNLSKIINRDQLKLLNEEYKKVPQWSTESV